MEGSKLLGSKTHKQKRSGGEFKDTEAISSKHPRVGWLVRKEGQIMLFLS
jgi:hypothetical protein